MSLLCIAFLWCYVLYFLHSDGRSGVFQIAEASGVRQGTKIVLHLKTECKEFSSEDRVKGKIYEEKISSSFSFLFNFCIYLY